MTKISSYCIFDFDICSLVVFFLNKIYPGHLPSQYNILIGIILLSCYHLLISPIEKKQKKRKLETGSETMNLHSCVEQPFINVQCLVKMKMFRILILNQMCVIEIFEYTHQHVYPK